MNRSVTAVGGLMLLAMLGVAACAGSCSEERKPARSSGQAAVYSTDHATATGAAARDKAFVASVQREPFHRRGCGHARRIADANLAGYDDRDSAIADGHRPCKVCQP